jgi:hypothetical protein
MGSSLEEIESDLTLEGTLTFGGKCVCVCVCVCVCDQVYSGNNIFMVNIQQLVLFLLYILGSVNLHFYKSSTDAGVSQAQCQGQPW